MTNDEVKVLIRTHSTKQTVQLGKRIGGRLRSGDVVALVGELGAGKTHLIKGLAAGVGVEGASDITSPSFTLIHEYQGRIPFYHLDLYRLAAEEDIVDLGIEEYLGREGVAVIEWADRIPSFLPKELLRITLHYLDARSRSVLFLGKGIRYETLLEELRREEIS